MAFNRFREASLAEKLDLYTQEGYTVETRCKLVADPVVKKTANNAIHMTFTINVINETKYPLNQYGYPSRVLQFHAHFANAEAMHGKIRYYKQLKKGDAVYVAYKENVVNGHVFLNLYNIGYWYADKQKMPEVAEVTAVAEAPEVAPATIATGASFYCDDLPF